MARRGRSIAGPILIALGLLMLLVQVGFSSMALVWILAILGVGIVLLAFYSQGRKHPAVLAGGVWLVLLGIHLLFIRLDWVSLSKSLPFFVMAPGAALLAVAASDRHNKDALTPAIILLGLSVLGFCWTLGVFSLILDVVIWIIKMIFKYVLPLALIAWGAWVVFRGRGEEPDEDYAPFPEKIEPEVMAAAAARATEGKYEADAMLMAEVNGIGEAEIEDVGEAAIEEVDEAVIEGVDEAVIEEVDEAEIEDASKGGVEDPKTDEDSTGDQEQPKDT